MQENNKPNEDPEGKLPAAPTGNASNPSERQDAEAPQGQNQLLDPKAEKYLRESASIEDMPDEQEWQDAELQLQKSKGEQGTS